MEINLKKWFFILAVVVRILVRIEDIVVVEASGSRNLNTFPKDFVLP